MSDLTPISVHPDSAEQKQQIIAQAHKQDESVSEYCLLAIERRIAEETEGERLDDLDVDSPLEELKETIAADVAAATDVDMRQDPLYGIALWNLLAKERSEEERRQALKEAPDKLSRELENITDKEWGEN